MNASSSRVTAGPWSVTWSRSIPPDTFIKGHTVPSKRFARKSSILRSRTQASSSRRYGRYIRAQVGIKLGPIQFLPSRTGKVTQAPEKNEMGLSDADANVRIEIEVAAHNRAMLADAKLAASSAVPDDVVRLLKSMASCGT